MKVTKNNIRVIKTLRWFKEAAQRIQPTNILSKESKTGFGLIHGFDGSALFIEAQTLADAWRTYREQHRFYDAYIPENSFLRTAGI